MPKISNVYQDKKSRRWYFVANLGYDEHGKRVQHWGRSYETQRAAKEAYDEYMNNYSKTAVKKNSTMNFQEFYETYFEPDYKRSVSQSTFDNRVSAMRLHFAFFFKRKLKDINPPMIKKWQNSLSEKKYSSAYIRLIFGMFQKVLDMAVTLGLLQRNIAKQVGNVKKTKQTVAFWTKEEFEKVIATFDLSDYFDHFAFTMIWLLFMTGLRFGEAQALGWGDIDFENQTLTVSKSMYYKSADEFHLKSPKTRAGNRVIALDENTTLYLQKWKEVQGKNIPSTNWVLSYNGIPTNKSAPKHIIERHSKLAEVHRIKTHALRHSHASFLIFLGEDAMTVRDRLGHEDIETTLGTYGHLYPNTHRAVANKLTNSITLNEDAFVSRNLISNQFVKRNKK